MLRHNQNMKSQERDRCLKDGRNIEHICENQICEKSEMITYLFIYFRRK